MKITCLGAARTVTGSAYLLEDDDNGCFMVDCGMFQGGRRIEKRNWDAAPYRPKELKAILITHAHIDHSGLVPRLVRMGFQGPVYASKATCELLKILWADSAHIQEMEALWQSRKNKRRGGKDIEPLYEAADAQEAMGLVEPVEMDRELEFTPGASAYFVGAGHILGAASLVVTVQVNGEPYRVGFSGDVGRPNQLIVPDPEVMPQPDALFMETTYGNRLHKSLGVSQEELIAAINQAYQEGGKVLIPVFAVERTQEVIFTLAAAYRRGELPQDMPVFLDSPLAIKATNIFREHPEFFDMQTKEILEQGHTPLNLPTLKPTPGTEESRAINAYKGPAVIMAGNGMASAGRIKHHLKHNLWRPNCHVVIVGFQAQGTTGRRLVEGARTVKVFREDVAVRAKVHTIGGFSAHADQKELLGWLERLERPGMLVNLIHGEEQSSLDFMAEAQKRFPEMSFRVPTAYQSMALPMTGEGEALPAEAAPRGPARRELADRLGRVRDRLSEMMLQLDSSRDMTPAQRLEFQRRLEAAERLLAGEEAA